MDFDYWHMACLLSVDGKHLVYPYDEAQENKTINKLYIRNRSKQNKINNEQVMTSCNV